MKKLDSKGPNFITLGVDFSRKSENGQILIGSKYDAYDSLFIAIEGIAMLIHMALKQGTPKKDIEKKVNQLNQALLGFKDYKKIKN